VIALGEGADVGDRKRVSRKRAVGTRDNVVAYLAGVHELCDSNGMAATKLATAVGYPGSSVAFAQLLSGMERSGLIEREVRGKRTYRIRLGSAPITWTSGRPARGPAGSSVGGSVGVGRSGEVDASAASAEELAAGEAGWAAVAASFDYDELARRLLVQVVRRLAGTEDAEPGSVALKETVAGLEYELASAWTKQGKLAEENARLREQLWAAQRSLALARESLRRLPITEDLDSAEVGLLQRLLAPADDAAGLEDPQSVDTAGLEDPQSVDA
jgi:hypothetical protein